MHDNNENESINEIKESNATKKRKSKWQMLALITSVIAIISLFGIWYVNNERAFLQIENIRLTVEAENLREEIKILQNTIAQNDNSVKDNNSKPNDPQTEITQTEGGYVNYEVKPGDTLSGISIALYGTEIYASQIAELNGFNADSILQVGQNLKTPKNPGE